MKFTSSKYKEYFNVDFSGVVYLKKGVYQISLIGAMKIAKGPDIFISDIENIDFFEKIGWYTELDRKSVLN